LTQKDGREHQLYEANSHGVDLVGAQTRLNLDGQLWTMHTIFVFARVRLRPYCTKETRCHGKLRWSGN